MRRFLFRSPPNGTGKSNLSPSSPSSPSIAGVAITTLAISALGISGAAHAQSLESFSLKGIKPLVNEASDYIKNRRAAERLGKALFWDIAAGSDGQSCASCHFAGGADNRIENQVAPGHDNQFDIDHNGNPTGPNAILTADHFPFLQQKDLLDRNSEITQDLNDRFSSQGTFNLEFNANGELFDDCTAVYDPSKPFHERGLINRIVEPRNTPTNINAGFYFRLALDGRARNVFTGPPNGAIVNTGVPSGPPSWGDYDDFAQYNADYTAYNNYLYGQGPAPLPVSLEAVALENSSLARQSTAPPLDNNEMTCAQRSFIDIARKLLDKQPLQYQEVHPDDSRLAGRRHPSGVGLKGTYRDMIKKAFHDEYWNDTGSRYSVSESGITEDADGVTQVEHNFLLFWGLSMQAYQEILVSDNAPIDRGRLNASAKRGFELFTGKANCSTCHTGPLFADSTTTTVAPSNLVNNVKVGDGGVALMDRGFHNIGVSPTSEDRGLGGPASGIPFSHTQQWVDYKTKGIKPNDPEVFDINPNTFDVKISENSSYRTAIDGAFKTTTLRNVGLTPPYFHDGSYATLKQVVQFYNRGGNTRGTIGLDSTGSDRAFSNLSFDIKPLGLTNREVNDIVKFLRSLTDNRVACHSSVFDHPSLPLTRGHADVGSTEPAFGRTANEDYWSILPAVGRKGLKEIGKPCFPNTGRLLGKAQTALNEITDFEPSYVVPEDKRDSGRAFRSGTPPTTDADEGWKTCATTKSVQRFCYRPELAGTGMTVRFLSKDNPIGYYVGGKYQTNIYCVPHMFGYDPLTPGVCQYKPN